MHTHTALLIILIVVVQKELKDTNLKNNPPIVILVKFLSLSTSERLAYKDSQLNTESTATKSLIIKRRKPIMQKNVLRVVSPRTVLA